MTISQEKNLIPQPTLHIIDVIPRQKFHRKLTVFSAGGPFLDGYCLGTLAVAIPHITQQWSLGSVEQGVLVASTMIGLFLGSLFGGLITDKVGRKTMYVWDLLAIAVFSFAQIWVGNLWELLILRLCLGLAVGADYPVATSLLTEFTGKEHRGKTLGWLSVMWSLGNAVAFIVGILSFRVVHDWKWIIVSPTILAVLLLIFRRSIPESPRWLAQQGRTEESHRAMVQAFGEEHTWNISDPLPHQTASSVSENTPEPATPIPKNNPAESAEYERNGNPPSKKSQFRILFSAPWVKYVWFISLFWTCSILPMVVLYSFGPLLIQEMDFIPHDDANSATIIIAGLLFLGTLLATVIIDYFRRRQFLIWTFGMSTACLLLLIFYPRLPIWLVVSGFVGYSLTLGGPTILQWIYPNEIFPTPIRATAIGVCTALSRIGSVAGTVITPILIHHRGSSFTIGAMAVISLIGVIVSILLAPETRDTLIDRN